MRNPVVILGIFAAIVFAALFVIFGTGPAAVIKAPSLSLSPASSTPLVLPPANTAASSTTSTPAPATTTQTAPPQPTAPATPPAPTYTKEQLDAAAAKLAAASVNIICSPDNDSLGLHTISGSGVIIDPRGIILTDAHVGQFFLLQNQAEKYAFECIIRTGNPAKDTYFASPIYVSSAWVRDNTAVITESAPTGSGVNDIALLGIDDSVRGVSMPAEFPYVPLSSSVAAKGDQIIIDSYAAQFLDPTSIASNLNQTVVYTTIKDIFTFDTDTVDLVSLGGSIAAQEGSSGGGAVNPKGELVALITTSTVTGDLTKRDLRALTANYIKRSVRADTGNNLNAVLTGSVPNLIEGFKKTADALAIKLIDQIQQNRN